MNIEKNPIYILDKWLGKIFWVQKIYREKRRKGLIDVVYEVRVNKITGKIQSRYKSCYWRNIHKSQWEKYRRESVLRLKIVK